MSVARGPGINAGHFYSNIVSPVKIDLNFVVDATNGNGLGVRSIKSNGFVRNVFMHTSSTPGMGQGGLVNPNPAVGYAMIQLKQNYNVYLGGFSGFVSPTTGSSISISGSSVLTAGKPYIITAVGAVPAPHFSVTAVADVSGSLAGKYLTISDAFSNNYVLWFQVSGVGAAPSLTGPLTGYQAVPVSIATGAANTAVASALSTVIAALNATHSFTTGVVGAVVTVTSAASPNLQLSPLPAPQTSGFTVSAITFTSLAADWQSMGAPVGFTPAVGMSFIAKATGGALGTGTVMAVGISGITSVEVIGDPNQSIANSSIAANGGSWVLVQFLAPTNSSTTTQIPTAPAAGSVVGMSLFFDTSSVTVDGL